MKPQAHCLRGICSPECPAASLRLELRAFKTVSWCAAGLLLRQFTMSLRRGVTGLTILLTVGIGCGGEVDSSHVIVADPEIRPVQDQVNFEQRRDGDSEGESQLRSAQDNEVSCFLDFEMTGRPALVINGHGINDADNEVRVRSLNGNAGSLRLQISTPSGYWEGFITERPIIYTINIDFAKDGEWYVENVWANCYFVLEEIGGKSSSSAGSVAVKPLHSDKPWISECSFDLRFKLPNNANGFEARISGYVCNIGCAYEGAQKENGWIIVR